MSELEELARASDDAEDRSLDRLDSAELRAELELKALEAEERKIEEDEFIDTRLDEDEASEDELHELSRLELEIASDDSRLDDEERRIEDELIFELDRELSADDDTSRDELTDEAELDDAQ